MSATEQKDAARRQREVRERVRERFDVSRDFLSGSYSRHTKTKPLKDVDVFFVLGTGDAWRRREAPLAILEALQACIKEHGDQPVTIGRRSVTVEFEKLYYSEDHDGRILSIDAVPAFSSGDDEYEIPDKVTGTWIKTNPDVHQAQSTRRNAELDGCWVPLVCAFRTIVIARIGAS